MAAENDRRIDYLEFDATDLPATKRFYATVFGWTFEDYGPAYAAFEDGRLTGGFRQVSSMPPRGSVLVILYATELEAARAAVVSGGGTIVKDIFSFPGGRRFHFADPNGNQLAVWSEASE